MYPNIDLERTGHRLKRMIANAGYSVKDIQEYLHLSCPQPVYRWFKGKTLPTVDHLYALSQLLKVHMEELLVPKNTHVLRADNRKLNRRMKRFYCYYEFLSKCA